MEFTTLRGGLVVRTDALRLAVALEAKGHQLTAKDGALRVSHGAALTAAAANRWLVLSRIRTIATTWRSR